MTELFDEGPCPCGCEAWRARSDGMLVPSEIVPWDMTLRLRGPNRRHPALISQACIMLADRIVYRVWHDGYPHGRRCVVPDCVFEVYKRCLGGHGGYIASLLAWRRSTAFGKPLGEMRRGQSKARWDEVQLMASGVPVWEVEPDVERMLADLRWLAGRLGVPQHDVVDIARAQMADVLAVIASA